MEKNNLAIALSGGSARGLAHIGFLEVLEENNIKVDHIVGTSMGALVGGIYAAGKLKELKNKILKLSKSKILSLLLLNQIKKGNTNVKEIEKFIAPIIKRRKMKTLNPKFTAIATNLKTGQEVYLEQGSLLKNIEASISIPGVFQPVKIKNMLLVDGGVIDPLPQEYAKKKAEKIIAVNVMPTKINYKKDGDTFDILLETISIMTNKLIRIGKKKHNDHLFIQIKTKDIDSFDFKNASKIIKLGRKAAKKHLRKIIKLSQS